MFGLMTTESPVCERMKMKEKQKNAFGNVINARISQTVGGT